MIDRQTRAAHLIIEDAYGEAAGTRRPTYEDFYGATTGDAPQVTDISGPRDLLIRMLNRAGIAGVNSTNLQQKMDEWRAENVPITSEKGATGWIRYVYKTLARLTREKILRQMRNDFENAPVENLEIQAQDLDRYDAFSAYMGGTQITQPPSAFRGIFAINTAKEFRPMEYQHLVAHEGYPGHHLQNVILHLLVTHGKLGPEAYIGTMRTPFHAFQEGWAQVVWEILAEDGIEAVGEKFGANLAVELASIVLQDCAKHDASILHLLEGKTIPEIQQLFTTMYCLSPRVVQKVSGFWAKDKKFGATVGQTYRKGSVALRDAAAEFGWPRVLPVALHTQGLVDYQGFQERMAAMRGQG